MSSIDENVRDRHTIRYSAKVRELDRQYERNNNCDVDNGVYNKENDKFDPFANKNEVEQI